MANLVAAYENYLLNIKHASANTVASYMRDIRQFTEYVSDIEDIPLEACDRDCICRYTQHLTNNGKSPSTVARCIASLKSFYSFCLTEGFVSDQPVHEIPQQKAEKKLPQILTGDLNCDFGNPAVQRLLEGGWHDTHAEATGIRDERFTFHGFLGEQWQSHPDPGPCGSGKMDWILARGPVRTLSSEIIKDHDGDLYPSDHYFAGVELNLS